MNDCREYIPFLAVAVATLGSDMGGERMLFPSCSLIQGSRYLDEHHFDARLVRSIDRLLRLSSLSLSVLWHSAESFRSFFFPVKCSGSPPSDATARDGEIAEADLIPRFFSRALDHCTEHLSHVEW